MVFQNNVLSGAGGSGTTTYAIGQSIRFNDGDNPYMGRTPSATGTEETWTWSFWVKRATLGTLQVLFQIGADKNNCDQFYFNTDDQLQYQHLDSGSNTDDLETTQVFRDPAAWYHIILAADTTNAVKSERIRIYVNGERVTNFATENYPTQNTPTDVNTQVLHQIGSQLSATYFSFDGYMAEIHLLDGLAYGPEFFGEFNNSEIWVPKEYTGSYGTNGFKIDGRDASDLGDDESGNGNDFTTSGLGAHDQVLDSPTNNFAVANPIHASSLIGSGTYAEGNLQVNYGTSIGGLASIAVSSGKWYAEWEIHSGSPTYFVLGIYGDEPLLNTSYAGKFANSYAYYSQDGSYYNNNVSNSYGNSYTVNDVIGIALDLDNNKLYFSKNGTFQNSGDPTSGSTGTGAISITSASSVPLGHYFIAGSSGSSAPTSHTLNYNFGQDGTFAGNVTAGGNSDANGVGNFKYTVPSGYLALCTKNLGAE